MSEDAEPRISAVEYREREAQMRQAAEEAQLPGLKAKFMSAAERWRQLADLAENPPRLSPRH
jgi:hypothetical protein